MREPGVGRPVPVVTLDDLPPPPAGRRGWPWTVRTAPLPPTLPGGEPWPPIGIVTPSYNQGRYLEATIRSVLLQGYPALEYRIEDGGSTDQSLEILARYAPLLSGWRSGKDGGQSHAINGGIARLEQARWVNWLNSDDVLLPGALTAVGRWAAAAGGAIALVGVGIARDVRGRHRYTERPRATLDGRTVRQWRTHSFMQPACFFSRSAFERVGGVNESLDYAMDFELWVKLGEIGSFDRCDDALAQALVHPRAKTQTGMHVCVGETCQVLFERGYAEDARRLIEVLYQELEFTRRVLRPVTENPVYRRVLRPLLRRWLKPPHLANETVDHGQV
jgi:glycosyltransferase involved in cell wall biosynthesis